MKRRLSLVLVLALLLTSLLPALTAGAEELAGTKGTVVLYNEEFNDSNSGWRWETAADKTAEHATLEDGSGILKFGWTAQSLVSPEKAISFDQSMTRMIIAGSPRFNLEYINGKNYNYYIDYLCSTNDKLDPNVSDLNTNGWQGFKAWDSVNSKTVRFLVTYDKAGNKNPNNYDYIDLNTYTGKEPPLEKIISTTEDGWRRTAVNNVSFALEKNGEPLSSHVCNSWYTTFKFAQYLGKMLADNKLYCGKGVSKILWSTVSNTDPNYQFTITEDDLDGTEKGIVEGGKTKADLCKTYSIADDCSDLYSETRINKINEELEKYYIALDKICVTADAVLYDVPVTITGDAEVTAVANTYTNEVQTIKSSGNISANDYFGLSFTVTPAPGCTLDKVEYAGAELQADENGEYTVAPENVKNGGLVITTDSEASKSKITYTKTGEGTVKIDSAELSEGENTAENGEHTFAVTPADGYEISSVTLGSAAIDVSNKLGFEFKANITEDVNLSVTFAARTNVKPALSITAQANVNNGNYTNDKFGANNANAITMYATVNEG